MLLPRKVGQFTLMRQLDTDGLTEVYAAILDDPPGKPILARRVLPALASDPARMAELVARVGDLRPIRLPGLAQVLDLVEAEGETYVVEEWVEGVSFAAIVRGCTNRRTPIPPAVYLHLAAEACNALEALHSRPGVHSGADAVLHCALTPEAVRIGADGRVTIGRFGVAASPALVAASSAGAALSAVDYLAPEQTHADPGLGPSADLFALGAILYELLVFRPLFRAETALQTLQRIRRAEVTTPLLDVKELIPGLDRVLFRALSLNARHRYQRAFVLREDLRGLMSGYTFTGIEELTRDFLAGLARGEGSSGGERAPARTPSPPSEDLPDSPAASLLADLTADARARARPPDPKAHAVDDAVGGVRARRSLPPPPPTPEPASPRLGAASLSPRTRSTDVTLAPEPDDSTTASSLPFPIRVATTQPPRERPTMVPLPELEPEVVPARAEAPRARETRWALPLAFVLAVVVFVLCGGAGALLALWTRPLLTGEARPGASRPPAHAPAPAGDR